MLDRVLDERLQQHWRERQGTHAIVGIDGKRQSLAHAQPQNLEVIRDDGKLVADQCMLTSGRVEGVAQVANQTLGHVLRGFRVAVNQTHHVGERVVKKVRLDLCPQRFEFCSGAFFVGARCGGFELRALAALNLPDTICLHALPESPANSDCNACSEHKFTPALVKPQKQTTRNDPHRDHEADVNTADR